MTGRAVAMLVALMVSGCAVLAAPGRADATTARLARVVTEDDGDGREDVSEYTSYPLVVAAGRERNRIRVRVVGVGRAIVIDRGSRDELHPGHGCYRRSRIRVLCRVPSYDAGDALDVVVVDAGAGDDAVDVSFAQRTAASAYAFVSLGAGDDRGHVASPLGYGPDAVGSTIDGGPGSDVLQGGRGPDDLRGGTGDDVIDGGPGSDQLAGGLGRDRLRGGPGGDEIGGEGGRDLLWGGPGNDVLGGGDGEFAAVPDVLDGGPGPDTVSYYGRRPGVRVTLGTSTGLTASARGRPEDRLRSVERATGGAGNDILIGSDGRNVLDGGQSGRDVLRGRGGADRLFLCAGGGVADGGGGDDFLGTGTGATDTLCGPGTDTVLAAARARVRPSCERVTGRIGASVTAVPTPTAVPGALRFTIHCGDTPFDCAGARFVLRAPALPRPGSSPFDPPAHGAELAAATLPDDEPRGDIVVDVPRDPLALPVGRPVVAALAGGRYNGTDDLLTWKLLLP